VARYGPDFTLAREGVIICKSGAGGPPSKRGTKDGSAFLKNVAIWFILWLLRHDSAFVIQKASISHYFQLGL
jgi:hypothetical protein